MKNCTICKEHKIQAKGRCMRCYGYWKMMGKDRNPQLKGWRKGDVTTAIFDKIADNPSTIRDIANATGCSMSSIRAYVKTWEKQGVITFDLVGTARGAYYAKQWRLVRDNTNERGTRA